MGEPVKIVDLACNMIRLSGKEPRLPSDTETGPRDIAVRFVGSRPGEKLHETLWGDDESVGETVHPKIMRLSRPPIDEAWLHEQLEQLSRLADEGDTLEVVAKLGSIVREPKRETLSAPTVTGAPVEAQPAPGVQLP
jgi:O-antigen biosynthesis protein WbqV